MRIPQRRCRNPEHNSARTLEILPSDSRVFFESTVAALPAAGSRLGNGLADVLGIMRKPAHEYAVGRKINRTKLDMRFKEKPIGFERDFQELRQFLIVRVGPRYLR